MNSMTSRADGIPPLAYMPYAYAPFDKGGNGGFSGDGVVSFRTNVRNLFVSLTALGKKISPFSRNDKKEKYVIPAPHLSFPT
jgi:hypothetical protein